MSLRKSLKNISLRIGAKLGVFGTGLTAVEDVRGQISRLRPIATDLIRFGPVGDGGYLIPDDLDGIRHCFSPGVCDESGFELDCANAGMKVYMADASVTGPIQKHEHFHFIPKYIGTTTEGNFVTLDRWIEDCIGSQCQEEGMLQMDIEGFEYETLLTLSSEKLKKFRIIVIEFHHLHLMWSRPYFQLMKATFDKLLCDHACVHIHPNNYVGESAINGIRIPQVMEFTFWRKDRISHTIYRTKFPHPLDTNNYSLRNISLPPCWYEPSPRNADVY